MTTINSGAGNTLPYYLPTGGSGTAANNNNNLPALGLFAPTEGNQPGFPGVDIQPLPYPVEPPGWEPRPEPPIYGLPLPPTEPFPLPPPIDNSKADVGQQFVNSGANVTKIIYHNRSDVQQLFNQLGKYMEGGSGIGIRPGSYTLQDLESAYKNLSNLVKDNPSLVRLKELAFHLSNEENFKEIVSNDGQNKLPRAPRMTFNRLWGEASDEKPVTDLTIVTPVGVKPPNGKGIDTGAQKVNNWGVKVESFEKNFIEKAFSMLSFMTGQSDFDAGTLNKVASFLQPFNQKVSSLFKATAENLKEIDTNDGRVRGNGRTNAEEILRHEIKDKNPNDVWTVAYGDGFVVGLPTPIPLPQPIPYPGPEPVPMPLPMPVPQPVPIAVAQYIEG